MAKDLRAMPYLTIGHRSQIAPRLSAAESLQVGEESRAETAQVMAGIRRNGVSRALTAAGERGASQGFRSAPTRPP